MARATKKEKVLTPEEMLQQALVPAEEQPYKVPENWCWVKLGNASEIIMGQSPEGSATTDDPSYMPLIGGAADMGVLYPKATRYTTVSTKIGKKDDVILCIRATLGRPIYSDGEYCLGRGVAAVRSEILIKEYLRYGLISFEQYLYDRATGTTFAQVSSATLQKMPFPIPPLAEQHRIISRIESLFAKLDEAKEKAQAVVDGFEDRKAAILHKAFSGELTKQWREYNKISKDTWKKIRLCDECKINPPKIDVKSLPDNLEVSFFPMPALSEIHGAITEPQTRPLGEVRTGFTNFSEGDVVFAKITPCMENGKSAVIGQLVNGIGFGTTEFFVLRCSGQLYNRFLWHLVRDRYFRDEAKSVMTGAVGQQRVPKGFLENYTIALPSIQEQFEIVRILDDCFEKELQVKENAEQIISQIDTMKKAILSRAFRGELGTKDPTDESAEELLKRIL